jgi:phage-related minor tail protein
MVARAQQQSGEGTEKATERMKKLKGEMERLPGAMPTAAQFDIGSRIGDAIDNAKQLLKRKAAELFKPLLDAWDTIQKELGKVGETFDDFKEIVVKVCEKIIEIASPIMEDIRLWLEENLPKAIEAARKALSVLRSAFIKVRRYVVVYLLPKLRELANNALQRIANLSQTIAEFWTDKLLPAFKEVRKFIKEKLVPIFDTLGEKISSFITNVLEWFKDVLDDVIDKVKRLWDLIGNVIQRIQEVLNWLEELPGEMFDVRSDVVPVTTIPTLAGAAQTITTTNRWEMNIGPNTMSRPLDVEMLAAAVERRLMRSMRI